jgi:hypothetical protein
VLVSAHIDARREPTLRQSYGASAERFNAEQRLGRYVARIIGQRQDGRRPEHDATALGLVIAEARKLGLADDAGYTASEASGFADIGARLVNALRIFGYEALTPAGIDLISAGSVAGQTLMRLGHDAANLGLFSVPAERTPTCDTLLCARPCRERGNGAINLCEDCAHERMRAMHDVISDILESPESMILPEHRRAALESIGMSEEDFR